MVSPITSVVFDSANPARVAEFWAGATGYELRFSNEETSILVHPEKVGPVLHFQKVPEARSGKNRVHVDMQTPDLEAEETRLIGLGASKQRTVEEGGFRWSVMNDPEGNEFCVVFVPKKAE